MTAFDDLKQDFDGLVRSLEDMDIAQKMLMLLLGYNPNALLGLLADMEVAGFGFEKILEIAPNEPNNTDRVAKFTQDNHAKKLMLANLRIAIQHYALNTAFEKGEKIIRASSKSDAIKNEPWFRIMAALRNATMHSTVLEDRRHVLFHKGEGSIEWNGISLSKSDLGNLVRMRMVADGAIWKLVRKMRDVVKKIKEEVTDGRENEKVANKDNAGDEGGKR